MSLSNVTNANASNIKPASENVTLHSFVKSSFSSKSNEASSISSMQTPEAKEGLAALSKVDATEQKPTEVSLPKNLAATVGALAAAVPLSLIAAPIGFIVTTAALIQLAIQKREEPSYEEQLKQSAWLACDVAFLELMKAQKENKEKSTPLLSQAKERKLLVEIAKQMVLHAFASMKPGVSKKDFENNRTYDLARIFSELHLTKVLDGTLQLEKDADYEALTAGYTKRLGKEAFAEALKKLSSEFKPMLQQIHALSGHQRDPIWGALASEPPLSLPSDETKAKLTPLKQSSSPSLSKWPLRLAIGGAITAASLLLSPILLPLMLLAGVPIAAWVVRKGIIEGKTEQKKEQTTLILPLALQALKAVLTVRNENKADWNETKRTALREKKELLWLKNINRAFMRDLFTLIPPAKEIENSPSATSEFPPIKGTNVFADLVKRHNKLGAELGAIVCQNYVTKRLRKELIKTILDGSILDQITEKEWKWLGRNKEEVKKVLLERAKSLRPVLEELRQLSGDPQNKMWDGVATS